MLMLQTVEFNLYVIAKSVSDAVRAG